MLTVPGQPSVQLSSDCAVQSANKQGVCPEGSHACRSDCVDTSRGVLISTDLYLKQLKGWWSLQDCLSCWSTCVASRNNFLVSRAGSCRLCTVIPSNSTAQTQIERMHRPLGAPEARRAPDFTNNRLQLYLICMRVRADQHSRRQRPCEVRGLRFDTSR